MSEKEKTKYRISFYTEIDSSVPFDTINFVIPTVMSDQLKELVEKYHFAFVPPTKDDILVEEYDD